MKVFRFDDDLNEQFGGQQGRLSQFTAKESEGSQVFLCTVSQLTLTYPGGVDWLGYHDIWQRIRWRDGT